MSEPDFLKSARVEALERARITQMPTANHGLTIKLLQPKTDEKSLKLESSSVICKSNVDTIDARQSSEFDKVIDLYFDPSFSTEENNHKLTHLHTAYADTVLFVVVKTTTPLVTIDLTHTKENSFVTLLILSQHNAVSKVHINTTAKENVKLASEQIRIISGSGSKIDVITTASIPQNTVHYSHKQAQIGENSNVNFLDLNLGTIYSKNTIESQLIKPNAQTKIKALSITNESSNYDLFTSATHAEKSTKSDIITRSVALDTSRTLSRGLIKINDNANGSEGYEKQEALILNKDAQANAIPNLEIHNHDVKCSHGSTIGRIDEERLFYLMSRGIAQKDAIKLIIAGYFTPIVAQIDDQSTQGKLLMAIEQTLGHKQ